MHSDGGRMPAAYGPGPRGAIAFCKHLTQRDSRFSLRDGRQENLAMAKLALIYGMRLLPSDDLNEVKDASVVLKNGKSARVTMHLIEGSKEEIEDAFHQSIEAFFEMYPEI
jgi:hypothetical protein